MEIQFFKKNVYGVEMIYVKNEKIKTEINRLTRKKTIDLGDITALKNLGFQLKEVLA